MTEIDGTSVTGLEGVTKVMQALELIPAEALSSVTTVTEPRPAVASAGMSGVEIVAMAAAMASATVFGGLKESRRRAEAARQPARKDFSTMVAERLARGPAGPAFGQARTRA